MQMPEKMVLASKAKAWSRGMPHQWLIRETLEKALR